MTGWFVILLAVAAAGAAGGLCRFWISGFLARRLGERFPWGTLVVNVSGAAAIGIVGALFSAPDPVPPGDRLAWALFVTGFLGSYTTVSAFSLQTLGLARAGETGRAAIYVAATLVLCLAAAGGGFAFATPGP